MIDLTDHPVIPGDAIRSLAHALDEATERSMHAVIAAEDASRPLPRPLLELDRRAPVRAGVREAVEMLARTATA